MNFFVAVGTGVAPDANGLPPAAHPGHPEVSDDVSQPPGAVQALKAAGEAGSMSLLLSRAAAGGREFMSLAVRYLEPSGQPVERLVVVKEPERDGELTGDVGQLLVEPFFALCKEAGNVDWRSKLIGVSLVGSGVSKDAFLDALNRRRGEEQLKELGCGAVRLDQRLVLALQGRGAHQQRSSPSASLRDFFCTIDSLRSLFCVGGRWFKVLQEKCRSLRPGDDPWLTYTSAVHFVSEERVRLSMALDTVMRTDPSLMIPGEAIKTKIKPSKDNPFDTCLLICHELFRVMPCFEDDLVHQHSDSIKNLFIALQESFSFPTDSFKPKLKFKLQSDMTDSQNIVQMCQDTTDTVLQQWRESWGPVLSLLEAIIHVLEDGNGGRGDHAAVTVGATATKTRGQTKAARQLQTDIEAFYAQFPDRFTSLEALMCGLPSRARFAKEFPALHDALTVALTAPLLPPRGQRAQDQLRAGALRAATRPWAWAPGTNP